MSGLKTLFGDFEESDVHELRNLIGQLIGGPRARGRILSEQPLQRRHVYRLTYERDNTLQTLVIKRFPLHRSYIEQRVIRRWLVVGDLAHIAPRLLGIAAGRTGQSLWHVYEDLGNAALEQGQAAPGADVLRDRGFLSPLQVSPNRDRLEVVVRLMSTLHGRFQGHPLLGECRQESGDLGIHFLYASVQDAIGALEYLQPEHVTLSPEHAQLRETLLGRLYGLREQMSWRTQLLERVGGPPTLLHGDFSVKNSFVSVDGEGLKGRLIDWDHAGVGPVGYDLSTFLMQLPASDRLWTLNCYQQARQDRGIPWPTHEEWNLLFDTHELARIASFAIGPAIAATEGQSEWAFGELGKIDDWFGRLQPVLPLDDRESISRSRT